MRRVKIILFVLLFIVFSTVIFLFISPLERSTKPLGLERDVTLNLGSGTFTMRIADSILERTRGLGGVEKLAQDEGMFFIFPENDFHPIWMKDMLIPIDIIWLSEGLKVIDTRENISPISFPEIFYPRAPARYVVELSAGAIKTFGIKDGSEAKILSE